MNGNKDNASPDRIFYCHMCGVTAKDEVDCHEDCAYEGEGQEYVRKSTADKTEMKLRHECIKQIEEILKPLRNRVEVETETKGINMHYEFRYNKLLQASEKTLSIADKIIDRK